MQAAANPPAVRATRAPDPVRVWRADSTIYVAMREPGHLLLLHVDGMGRIAVLFPFGPYDSNGVEAGVPFAVPLPPEAQGNPATVVAVRSRWAFDFTALRGGLGGTWDYQNAWLLQPTAGDPLGAVLDIAERVTNGRPYDYGGVRHQRNGTAVALGEPLTPQVCLGCVRRAPPVVVASAPVPSNAVDCSNASLTNSFCGVASGSVSITSTPPQPVAYQPPPAPAPVYVPYYLPVFVNDGMSPLEQPNAPTPPPPAGGGSGGSAGTGGAAAFPIAPRAIVPSSSELRTIRSRRP
jgi:hypothetical protein